MIRDAQLRDAEQVAEIYDRYIREDTCTFETEPLSAADMRERIGEHQTAHDPWLVMEERGRVIGYAYAHQFRPRQAYRHTCECSVYVDRDELGRGLGKELISALLERLRSDGRYYTAIAVIVAGNEASVGLFEGCGFKAGGRLPKVGRKFGLWLDTLDMYCQLRDYDLLEQDIDKR